MILKSGNFKKKMQIFQFNPQKLGPPSPKVEEQLITVQIIYFANKKTEVQREAN